jgi:para-aminobenzoate synthetase component I
VAGWAAGAQIHERALTSFAMKSGPFFEQLNTWGSAGTPFLFVIDFEMQRPVACKLEDAAAQDIFYDIQGLSNMPRTQRACAPKLDFHPVDFEAYKHQFDYVSNRLHYGDSFLTNLTIRTELETKLSLKELLSSAYAKYRLLFRNEFLVFSPETFIRIANGKIYTNPMKGTIDASIAGAEQKLLNDQKELAEHVTIVDLLRNDLSQVADAVELTRFRYIEKLKTSRVDLLQMSSEVTGVLPNDFAAHIGDILFKLLPAGSVTGAPKQRTLKIIREAEGRPRGFYTGVFGYFDGSQLDSGVMIRFIEQDGGRLYYRSGGGITAQSNVNDEYREAIDKIYVPID